MAKILHAADIHLDSPLQKLARYEGAPVEKIRGASRRALSALAESAIAQNVDLVVIAGDLYDGDWVDQNTGLFFVGIANRLVQAGIPIVVIRGNHDAANLMTRSLPLPSNPDGSEIMLSSKRPETRIFESPGIAVHGRSFPTRAVTENLAVDYPGPLSGYFNLGLLHTSLTGAEGHDPYAPCTPQYLTEKGYDYWALGHVHTPADHAVEGGPPIVFPGNLQGRHAGECGARGFRIIEFDSAGKIDQRFEPLDVVRWERVVIDAGDIGHVDEILDRYRDWLVEWTSQSTAPLTVTRVDIIGETDLHTSLFRSSDSLRAQMQAIAITTVGDRVWMEDVRVRTSLASRRQTLPDDSLEQHDAHNPMSSLRAAAERIQDHPDVGTKIESELQALIKKLGQGVGGLTQEIRVHDPQWTRRVVNAAIAEIEGRLED